MQAHNPKNERIKRAYFEYAKEALGYSEQTIDATAAALARFERFTKFAEFKDFRKDQAIDFKEYLSSQKGPRGEGGLSKATILSTVNVLKTFVRWLSREPGYKHKIRWGDADYFNLTRNDVAIAKASREKRFPTVEQVRRVIEIMPQGTEIEMRDRAIIAFTLMTAARVGAIASLQLIHADPENGVVYQDARQVNTKFRKSFPTYFMPVGEEVH